MSASSDYQRVSTDIIRGKGTTAAATARANGQIWGNAISQLGDYASDAIKQYAVDKKAKKAEQEDQALRDLFDTANREFQQGQQPSVQQQTGAFMGPQQPMGPGNDLPQDGGITGNLPRQGMTPQESAVTPWERGPSSKPLRTSPFPTASEILHQVGPIRGIPIVNGITAIQKLSPQDDNETKVKRMQAAWLALNQLPEDQRAQFFPGVQQGFAQVYGLDIGQDTAYTPEKFKAIGAGLKVLPEGDKSGLIAIPGPDGKPVYGRPQEGQPVYEKPAGGGGLVPVPGPDGKPVYGTPTAGAPVYEKTGADSGRDPTEWSLIDAAAKGDPAAVKALQIYRQQHPTGGGAAEPLVAVMGPDGKPVLVRRSQAEGKTPASNREQGRNVTSGDVGRITDLDASLSDLNVLQKTIGSVAGATGISASVGASLPNWATSLTGWGTDAKKKQAMIDRVKQVIGKSLEGGVLRKEDEIKYERILPTISDPSPVVAAKLSGLKAAIGQRRTQFLDNLEDANYDTSRYRGRDAGAAAPAKPVTGRVGPYTYTVETP